MGGLMSSFTEPLVNRKSECYNNFLIKNPDIDDFRSIEDNLTWCEKTHFGLTYQVWKKACLYKFMVHRKTDISAKAADLITDFGELEQDVIVGFQNSEINMIVPMLILYNVVGKKEYNDYMQECRYSIDSPLLFKEEVNRILGADIV